MRLKVFFLALTSTLTVSANDDTDSTIVFKQDLSNVTITGHNEIRMLREAAMPVSVLGARQLDGTATSINDVLARTTGVTIRVTRGLSPMCLEFRQSTQCRYVSSPYSSSQSSF